MDDENGESKDLTKPGSKSLSRVEERACEVARFLEDLSFLAAAGHAGPVTVTSFSPDGSQVASGSYDGTVKVWDPKTGRLLATFLSAGRSGWMTYTQDGYLIGSDEAMKRVMMKWKHGGNQYSAVNIFPRENPNPRKVAEALASTRPKKPKPRKPTRRPPGLSGERQRQLEPPNRKK